MEKSNQKSFEEKVKRLEEISQKFDQEDIKLEEMVALVKEAQTLEKELLNELEEAKKQLNN